MRTKRALPVSVADWWRWYRAAEVGTAVEVSEGGREGLLYVVCACKYGRFNVTAGAAVNMPRRISLGCKAVAWGPKSHEARLSFLLVAVLCG